MDYLVKIESFEGPLDLLLYLIKKQEIDIYDIPIAEITKQYLEFIRIMDLLNLELAGEFLVMAATLLRIKARMLLPKTIDQDGEEEDPRHELVQQLLQYQRFKRVASTLQAMEYQRSLLFPRPESTGDGKQEAQQSYNVFDLISAFKRALERMESTHIEIEEESISIEERIEYLKIKLLAAETVRLEALLDEQATVVDLIVTFLALLELLRMGLAKARQSKPFGPIWITRIKGNLDDRGAQENC